MKIHKMFPFPAYRKLCLLFQTLYFLCPNYIFCNAQKISLWNSLEFINLVANHHHNYKSVPICQTLVFPNDFEEFKLNYLQLLTIPFVLPITNIKNSNSVNKTIYSNEFSELDLFQPTLFGTRKLTSNCISGFINASLSSEVLKTTVELINSKLLRPHKDYFVFVKWKEGESDFHLNLQMESNTIFQDIRFKYELLIAPSIKFINHCNAPLFSRNCDPIISNRHYTIVSSSIQPFVHFDSVETWTNPTGIMVSLIKDLSQKYNFTFSLKYSGYLGSSGFKDKESGIWKGAVGEVFNREADIAFSVATTVHRFPINDPSVTQTWIKRYFYIPTPAVASRWEAIIIWPLRGELWYLTIGTIVVLVIPSYFWIALNYFENTNRTKMSILNELLDALWRIIMEQSATVRHWKGSRIRCMILLWTGFCLIIVTGYRSKLITFLTFIQPAPVPRTHFEISQSPDYKLYFRWMGGVAYKHLIGSSDPMHQRILRKAIMINSSEECLFAALFEPGGTAAWLDYSINVEFAIKKFATLKSSDSTTSSELFVKSIDSDYSCHIIWSFRKGSPWIESFDKGLLNLLAGGFYDLYKTQHEYQTSLQGSRNLMSSDQTSIKIRNKIESVLQNMIKGPKPLTNNSLYGLYLIFWFGLIGSWIVWGFECLSVYISIANLKNKMKSNGNNHNFYN